MKAKARSPETAVVVAFLAALTLAGCADEARMASPTFVLHDAPEERACAVDADCAAVFLPCKGWRPVRRDRADALATRYERDNREEMRRSDCADAGDSPPPATQCAKTMCALAEAPAGSGV